MSGWVRVDTRFTTHPKVLEIGPLGEALWLRGLCYAGEHLTDGFVPAAFVRRMNDIDGEDIADRLLDAGLWTQAEGGYQIHEYLSWQRSRDEAADISIKRSESGRKGGLQKASNIQANGKQPSSKLLASPASKRLADTDTDTDTETENVYTADFLDFWSHWPKKGDAKLPAFKAWRNLSKAKREAARTVIPSWLAYYASIENRHIPNCTTWLNQARWEVDPPPVEQSRPQNGNGRYIEARDNYGDFSGPDKGGTHDPATGKPIPMHEWGNR
jgi:hypothetical protein